MESSKLRLSISTILTCFVFLELFFLFYQPSLTPVDVMTSDSAPILVVSARTDGGVGALTEVRDGDRVGIEIEVRTQAAGAGDGAADGDGDGARAGDGAAAEAKAGVREEESVDEDDKPETRNSSVNTDSGYNDSDVTVTPDKVVLPLERKPMCTMYERTNVCQLNGDVRVNGSSASVFYIDDSFADSEPEEMWVIKPYPRTFDDAAMSKVREVKLRRQSFTVDGDTTAPECTVDHGVPGVIYSGAGFAWNFYHDFSDILVPLYLTTQQYGGEVKILVTDINIYWIIKYKEIFQRLSNYDVIDLDKEDGIHCFRNLTVWLYRPGEFTTMTSSEETSPKSPSTPTLIDFAKFLRASFSLDRDLTTAFDTPPPPPRKPRLLLLSRKRSRRFLNVEQIGETVKKAGYELVVAEAGQMETKDFAQVVNSCDVLMGVLGAGLTNMLFLPTKGTLIIVVPWGRMEGIGWYNYGSVAGQLGLKYVEYKVAVEESSLSDKYPRNHPLLTDAKAIDAVHRQGWDAFFNTFMMQDFKINLKRLRRVLVRNRKFHQL